MKRPWWLTTPRRFRRRREARRAMRAFTDAWGDLAATIVDGYAAKMQAVADAMKGLWP